MNLPPAIFEQHIAVLGKTRSGKSSVMRLFVEDLLDRKQPVCIIDPKGDWWGLKSSASGKRAGYPVVIFGGDHADVPINAHAGGQVAELVATGNRPCIIDLGGWMVGDRTRFFVDFASGVFRQTKGHRWLVIDEVHNFAPQGKVLDPDAGKMLHWANRLASEGLGKGLAIISASQRPQKVHKDFLTCSETLIAMRVIHPLDRGAVKDWIDGCPDAEKGKQVLSELASMPRGEGWVWSPEIGFGPKRIAFPMFSTFDSFRPRIGQHKLKGWASVNLDDVRAKLAEVVEKAKANDPTELRKQLAAERQRGAELETRLNNPIVARKAEVKRVEVPILKDGQLARVEKLVASFNGQIQRLSAELSDLRDTIKPALAPPEKVALQNPLKPPVGLTRGAPSGCPRAPGRSPSSDEPLAKGKGETRLLIAIAQHQDGVTREQLSILAGYKRSSRDTYLQRLRAAGQIEQNSDGRLRATEAGIAALGTDHEPLPTGDALRAYWLDRLDGGERVLLGKICEAYPAAVDRDALSETTNYKRSSRDTFLQRLSARWLVVCDRGSVRAAEELFG